MSFGGRTWDGAATNGFTNEVDILDLANSSLGWNKQNPISEERGYAAACLYESKLIYIYQHDLFQKLPS